jgi:phosphonate degradation associated HDIG domain protein
MPTIMSPVDAIAELFASAGAADYLGEPVTVATHLLQSGALAEEAGAPPSLVAAALLHDVGHLRGADARADGIELSGRELMAGTDNNHGERGAQWLASLGFPASVTEPVRLHVAAKRYLCAAEPAYFGQLSEASVYTLAVQGGPMSDAEAREFEREPHAAAAIAVRRWDDQAKDPSAATPGFPHFRALLGGLL